MRTENFRRSLDELETDLIVATLFENEQPPLGVTGLIDWRLNGFLSRMILRGALKGRAGESILVPLQRRLPARRLLLLGLGRPEQFHLADVRRVAEHVGRVISHLGTVDVSLALPSARDERAAGDTEHTFFESLGAHDTHPDLLVRWLSPSIVKQNERSFLAEQARTL